MNAESNKEKTHNEGPRRLTEAERALVIRRGGADEDLDKSIELSEKAKALHMRGEYSRALLLLEEAEQLRRKVPAREWLACLLLPKAGILTALGRHEDSLTALREAADLYRELGDFDGLANSLGGRRNNLKNIGRFEEAVIQSERQAAAERGQMTSDNPLPQTTGEETEPLRKLALLERLQRNLENRRSSPALLQVLDTKTRLCIQLHRPDKALDSLNEIEKICRKRGMTVVRSLLETKAQLLVLLGRPVEALQPLMQAEKRCKESGNLKGIAEILDFRITVLSKLGRIEEAVVQVGRKVTAENGQMPSDGGLPQGYWDS